MPRRPRRRRPLEVLAVHLLVFSINDLPQQHGRVTAALRERIGQLDAVARCMRAAAALRDGACEQEPAVISALVDGLTDDYHYVRGFSALALEKIGTPAALGAAQSHLQTMRFD